MNSVYIKYQGTGSVNGGRRCGSTRECGLYEVTRGSRHEVLSTTIPLYPGLSSSVSLYLPLPDDDTPVRKSVTPLTPTTPLNYLEVFG